MKPWGRWIASREWRAGTTQRYVGLSGKLWGCTAYHLSCVSLRLGSAAPCAQGGVVYYFSCSSIRRGPARPPNRRTNWMRRTPVFGNSMPCATEGFSRGVRTSVIIILLSCLILLTSVPLCERARLSPVSPCSLELAGPCWRSDGAKSNSALAKRFSGAPDELIRHPCSQASATGNRGTACPCANDRHVLVDVLASLPWNYLPARSPRSIRVFLLLTGPFALPCSFRNAFSLLHVAFTNLDPSTS